MGKESACNAGDPGNVGPCIRKIPWRREWQPLPGKSHGQRSLAGYSPRGCKESDTTEYTHTMHAKPLKRIWQIIKMVIVCIATVVVFLETWGRHSSITLPGIFCVDEYLHDGFFPLKGGAYFPLTACGMNSEICFQSCECGRNDHMWFLKLGHKVRATWLSLSWIAQSRGTQRSYPSTVT